MGLALVKIVFELERDEDGYPPEKWEGVWSKPLGGDRFQIDNVPFFVRGVSCDDIVRAVPVGGELRFEEVIEPSSNSTIRVIVYDLNELEAVRCRLKEFGCDVEGTGIAGLLAANVPRGALEKVLDFVRLGFNEDRWDFEEGAVRAR